MALTCQNESMAVDPASRTEAGRFAPGYSGNPKGRKPEEFSFLGILRSALAEENKSGKSVGERIIARYIKLALAGNGQALEALVARIDGKPAQSLTLKGESDAPLHVRHSARLEAPRTPTETDKHNEDGWGPTPQLPAPEQGQEAAGGELGRTLAFEAELNATRAAPDPDTTE